MYMPRNGSTPFALLGLLSIQPMSGYDIRKSIQEDLIYFWNESFGQIYPALKHLAKQGLIAPVRQAQGGRRSRKVFALTSKGREHLQEWLGKPPQAQPVRNEYLLKMFFGKAAPAGALCRHLEQYRREQEQFLAMYDQIRAHTEREHAGRADQKFWLAMLDRGLRVRRAELAWCNDTLEAFCSRSKQEKNARQDSRQ
jgi:DNA-binding PadR family transcriptional regulator